MENAPYIRQAFTPSERDYIIDRVGRGEITREQAEAEAEKIGVGPLASKPDPSTFDPMREAYWSLPMALIWLETESVDEVREVSNDYRRKVWHWEETERGWVLRLMRAVELLDLTYRPGHRAAKELFWRCAKNSEIAPTARLVSSGERVSIPPPRWYDLEMGIEMVQQHIGLHASGVLWCYDVLVSRIECIEAQARLKQISPAAVSPDPIANKTMLCGGRFVLPKNTVENAAPVGLGGLRELAAQEYATTSKSIPTEECVALAHRVTGDPRFVEYVRKVHFDSLRALAKCLAYEMVAEDAIVATSASFVGERLATVAHPKPDGRFKQVIEAFQLSWLSREDAPIRPASEGDRWLPPHYVVGCCKVFPFGTLVEYLEHLFRTEMGAISREQIEQIGLELADAGHRTNGSEGIEQKKRARTGRKPNPLWDVCCQDALAQLEEKGAPRPDDDDPLWRTQADFERWILNWWTQKLPRDAKLPSEGYVREHAGQWLRKFEEGKKGQ
jgi:hypothetical protein